MSSPNKATSRDDRTDLASVCNLPADGLEARLEMIRTEILPHVVRSEKLADGFAWECAYDADLHAKLERLVDLERDCCGSLDFVLSASHEQSSLRLEVHGLAPGAGLPAGLGEATEPDRSQRSGWARLAGAGGIGVAGAFFAFCILPVAVAAVAGAAVAAPLARFDNPVAVAVGAVVLGGAVWLWQRRRGSAKPPTC